MKTRSGFVSNSSSSSFIVRGIKVNFKEICKKMGIKKTDAVEDDGDGEDDILFELTEKMQKTFKVKDIIEIRAFQNFFSGADGEEFDEVIIGADAKDANLEDGDVVEIKSTDSIDDKVRTELAKLGFKDVTLSTFVHYLSNDNY